MMVNPIDVVLKNEGGYSQNPVDKGGETAYGISKKSNPEAWKNGPPTETEARGIYQKKYIDGPGFARIPDSQLRTQLVDFGVNSGPFVAIKKLQEILKVPTTGVLGPETMDALATIHPEDVNNLLVAARVRMIGEIVSKNKSQIVFLNGWLDRALQFLL